MYAKTLALFVCIATTGLSSCTTEPESGQLGPTPESIPEPEISIELPLERENPQRYAAPQACLLSSAKSCMELDPRPFEPCLVTSKSCEREGARVMPVAPAANVEPPAVESR
jgi:hypothetical protein